MLRAVSGSLIFYYLYSSACHALLLFSFLCDFSPAHLTVTQIVPAERVCLRSEMALRAGEEGWCDKGWQKSLSGL